MHLIVLGIAVVLLLLFVFGRAAGGGSGPKIDQTALSPYEREINGRQFDSLVLQHSSVTPVLVDFYAHWCGPCHAFSPVLSELAKACDGSFLLAKIDFDQNKALAAECGVTALPGVVLFRDGKRVDGFDGGRLPHTLRYFLAKNGIAVPDDF